MSSAHEPRRAGATGGGAPGLRVLAALLTGVTGLALGWAVLSLPEQPVSLAQESQTNIAEEGVTNPTTAVLLDFRSYDTMLEVGVLLLAVICVWALGLRRSSGREENAAGIELLRSLTRVLVPVMILVGAYLLWLGSSSPGGAFQGGAVLAAVGVLLILSGDVRRLPGRWPLLGGLAVGFAAFLGLGVAVSLVTGTFLEYPAGLEYPLIVAAETAITISIAVSLAVLFFAAAPDAEAGE